MIEEISYDLYRVEIPLPGNPLKSINSYFLKSPERNLIIDTGMNRKACREVMQAALEKLEMDLAKTDFFITHLHADHFGLVGTLATETSKVYFNRPDAEIALTIDVWDTMIEGARIHGFPEEILEAAKENHPGRKYGVDRNLPLTLLEDGDTIEIGGYSLRCVQTPGHTRGHMCLYDAEKKFFFSGDHILIDITPNIQLWTEDENPLEDYLNSLDRVSGLEVKLVLPGHRSMVGDCRKRIQELKDHHRQRADEALSILEKGAASAHNVASQMTWDIDCPTWEDFPVMQRWFATGETIAHLKYLEERDEINSDSRNGKITFSLK